MQWVVDWFIILETKIVNVENIFIFQIKGQPLDASERVRQLPEGSLQIAGVAREDAGEYSCHVDNQFGTDTVTHTLSVLGEQNDI